MNKLTCTLLLMLAAVCVYPKHTYSQIINEQLTSSEPQIDFSIYNQSKEKSPQKAFWLSAGITTGAILSGALLIDQGYDTPGGILLSAGIIIAPSAGNMYVGNGRGVSRGIGTRFLGSSLAALGSTIIVLDGLSAIFGGGDTSTGAQIGGSALLIGGLGLTAYSMIFDWFNSARYARRLNQKDSNFQVSPGYDPYSGKPTLNFKLRF